MSHVQHFHQTHHLYSDIRGAIELVRFYLEFLILGRDNEELLVSSTPHQHGDAKLSKIRWSLGFYYALRRGGRFCEERAKNLTLFLLLFLF